MTQQFSAGVPPVVRRAASADATAPDGSEIRLLIGQDHSSLFNVFTAKSQGHLLRGGYGPIMEHSPSHPLALSYVYGIRKRHMTRLPLSLHVM